MLEGHDVRTEPRPTRRRRAAGCLAVLTMPPLMMQPFLMPFLIWMEMLRSLGETQGKSPILENIRRRQEEARRVG